jgi:hypothetical protein
MVLQPFTGKHSGRGTGLKADLVEKEEINRNVELSLQLNGRKIKNGKQQNGINQSGD